VQVVNRVANQAFFVVGFVLVTIAMIYADEHAFPFPWAIPSVIGTAFLIHALVGQPTHMRSLGSVLEMPLMRYIGKISYSLYLWHWPIFVFFRWSVGLQSVVEYCAAVALTFVCGMLSFHFIERRFSALPAIKQASSRVVVPLGLLVICLSYGFGWLMFKAQHRVSLSVTSNSQIWSPYVAVPPAEGSKPWADRTLYVIGDSHAGAYKKMLGMLQADSGINVKVYSRNGCGVLNLMYPVMTDDSPCAQKLATWLQEIEGKIKPQDIIFLASLKMARLAKQSDIFAKDVTTIINENNSEEAMHNRTLALAESQAILARLTKLTPTLIVDSPKPVFPYQTFRCADWYTNTNPICAKGPQLSRAEINNMSKDSWTTLAQLQSEFPNIIIWNVMDALCPDTVCQIYDNQQPLYFDGDHLTGYGNAYLYPTFQRFIQEVIAKQPFE